MLISNDVASADEPSIWPAVTPARLDDFALHMYRVVHEGGAFDVVLHAEKSKTCVLHGGLYKQALRKAEHQRTWRRSILNVRLMFQKLEVRKKDLGHSGAIDEIDDIGLGDRTADRLEASTERQIFEVQP